MEGELCHNCREVILLDDIPRFVNSQQDIFQIFQKEDKVDIHLIIICQNKIQRQIWFENLKMVIGYWQQRFNKV